MRQRNDAGPHALIKRGADFKRAVGAEQPHHVARRNAKLPGVRFEPDGTRKAAVFDAAQAQAITQRLSALHQALIPPAEHAVPTLEVADAY